MTGQAIDHDTRLRLRTEHATTFFVEAGAGTGKTRELVARIVELVARGEVRMESLAAITFTELAAAELRDRVRQGLEQAAREPGKVDPEADQAGRDAIAERCRQAAAEVDLAAIQTLHSFAGSLLRTFPLEAGLPPGFVTWDAIQHSLAFEERFRAWLYDEAPSADHPARETLRRALALGLTPDSLRGLALALEEQADLLERLAEPEPADRPALLGLVRAAGRKLLDLVPLTRFARLGEADALVQEVLGAEFAAARLAAANDEHEALLALLDFERRLPKYHNIGRLADWDQPDGSIRLIRAVIKQVRSEVTAALAEVRSATLAELLVHLGRLTRTTAEERREQGVATFQDLLVRARNLLRDHPEVRRQAHARFERIMIDEFQDTDPLQAEIAWYLAADPALAEERDWRDLAPRPGRLFLVGDPKQSIYRFRRADIALYDAIGRRIEEVGDRAVLRQSFRTAGPVVDWVNDQLGQDMVYEAGVQARYENLAPRAIAGLGELEDACGVFCVGEESDGRAAERWEREARDVALVARSMVAARQQVSVVEGGTVTTRPVEYRDICVLLPTRTNLRRLERAFEREGVPYRLDSGSLVLATQEVRDLLACLRAVDDPSDQVALVAALRSPAYACSDADLLRWVEAGGRLDYLAQGAGCAGPVEAAFGSLRELHQSRLERSSAATVERLIQERLLAALAFDQPRPREAWRRLRYVVGQARALAASGQPSLRALLDWLDLLGRRGTYDAEAPVPESDENAVRFLTVHGAKGLEFPVVILTGLGSPPRGYRGGPQLAVDRLTGRLEARCAKDFQTRKFDAEREEKLDRAERIRLLYVAATRAREVLVLSLHRGRPAKDETKMSHAERIAARLDERVKAERPALCRSFTFCESSESRDSGPAPAAAAEADPDLQRWDEVAWREARRAVLERRAEVAIVTASGLAARGGGRSPADQVALEEGHLAATEAAEAGQPARGGRGGTALGRAVHAVLERVDLAAPENLAELAAAAAAEQGLAGAAGEVQRLSEQVLASSAVRRAAAGRHWKELAVGITVGGTILDGQLDLLYEHADGSLGVVDYKTDRLGPDEVRARGEAYAIQAGAYALAVARATGRRVTSIELVFAALAEPVVAYDEAAVQGLMAEVERLIRAEWADPEQLLEIPPPL